MSQKRYRNIYIFWRVVTLCLLIFVIFASFYLIKFIQPIAITDIGLLGFIFIFIAGIVLRLDIKREMFDIKRIIKSIVVILGSLLVVMFFVSLYRLIYSVNNYDLPFGLILYMPQMMFYRLAIIPTTAIDALRPFVVVSYTVSPLFHPILIALWLFEIILPGWIIVLYSLMNRIISFVVNRKY